MKLAILNHLCPSRVGQVPVQETRPGMKPYRFTKTAEQFVSEPASRIW